MDLKKFAEHFSKLKERFNFKVVDSHIHPCDVMGVVHFDDMHDNRLMPAGRAYLNGGVLEKLGYGKLEKIGSRLAFSIAPKIINQIIKKTYTSPHSMSLLNRMDISLVDSAVLLPVEPWVK